MLVENARGEVEILGAGGEAAHAPSVGLVVVVRAWADDATA